MLNTRAELSAQPVASWVPSGLNATAPTGAPCGRVINLAPVTVLNRSAVPSSLPVASRVPSGLKATERTGALWLKLRSRLPVATSVRRTTASSPALASRCPSVLAVTTLTGRRAGCGCVRWRWLVEDPRGVICTGRRPPRGWRASTPPS